MTRAEPVIETSRLRLRAFNDDDIDVWARLIYADPEATRFLPGPDIAPRERATRLYRLFTELWPVYGYGGWAVTDRATGAFLGPAGLNRVVDLEETEIDFALARHAWGRGLATESGRAVVAHAFDVAGLARLIGFVMRGNTASAARSRKARLRARDRHALLGRRARSLRAVERSTPNDRVARVTALPAR